MNQVKIEICESYVIKIIREKLRIKYSYFKGKVNEGNWSANIQDLQDRLSKEIKTTPHIYNYLESQLDVIYCKAIKDLTKQLKFKSACCPFKCPYTLSQIISR